MIWGYFNIPTQSVLESTSDDRLLLRIVVVDVSRLRSVLCFGPRETSRIKRMVESAAQEGMAQAQSLHDARLTNGASPEPADAC